MAIIDRYFDFGDESLVIAQDKESDFIAVVLYKGTKEGFHCFFETYELALLFCKEYCADYFSRRFGNGGERK